MRTGPTSLENALACLDTFFSCEAAPASPEDALERCSAAKLELLHPVVGALGQRNRIVEAQRTERRCPDQADTHRGADHISAVILQSETGSRRRHGPDRWPDTTGRVDLAGGGPGRRSLVIPQPAGVGIDRTL